MHSASTSRPRAPFRKARDRAGRSYRGVEQMRGGFEDADVPQATPVSTSEELTGKAGEMCLSKDGDVIRCLGRIALGRPEEKTQVGKVGDVPVIWVDESDAGSERGDSWDDGTGVVESDDVRDGQRIEAASGTNEYQPNGGDSFRTPSPPINHGSFDHRASESVMSPVHLRTPSRNPDSPWRIRSPQSTQKRRNLPSIATLKDRSATRPTRPSILDRASPGRYNGSVTSRSSVRALQASNDVLQAELERVTAYAEEYERLAEGRMKRLRAELAESMGRVEQLDVEVERVSREASAQDKGAASAPTETHREAKERDRSAVCRCGGAGTAQADQANDSTISHGPGFDRVQSRPVSEAGPPYGDYVDLDDTDQADRDEPDTHAGAHQLMLDQTLIAPPTIPLAPGVVDSDVCEEKEAAMVDGIGDVEDDIGSDPEAPLGEVGVSLAVDLSSAIRKPLGTRSILNTAAVTSVGIGGSIRRRAFDMWLDIKFVGIIAWFVIQCARLGRKRIVAAAQRRSVSVESSPMD